MKISIVGCGWLGLPLGEHLSNLDHEVSGSTTSETKFEQIEKAGVTPVLLKLSPMPEGKEFNKLFSTDLLFINIPPGRKRNTPEFYGEQIKYLRYLVDNSSIQKVIFISSTSYYPNTNGKVHVSTPYNYEKGSSRAVVLGEQEISKTNKDLLILRCGGLMGGTRVPGKWFSGRETAGKDTPVNYIHRSEILRIVEKYVAEWPREEGSQIIKNLVSPHHPTRQEVQEASAQKHNFQAPKWTEPNIIPHKIVESSFTNSGLNSPVDY